MKILSVCSFSDYYGKLFLFGFQGITGSQYENRIVDKIVVWM